jgi:N4-gp56 family major capsid protein
MPVLARADIAGQIAKLWSERLFYQAEKRTFFSKFEGPPGSNAPVVRLDDLDKQVGDTVFVDIVLALAAAGAAGDTALLEGNEEKMKFRQTSVLVDSLQHAVRWTKLGKVLINHDMRAVALNLLRKHLAGRLDDQIFNEASGGTGATYTEANLPTSMKFFAGAATSIVTVTSALTPTLNDISDMKALATTQNLIEPIEFGDSDTAEEMYILVLHPYAALGLKKDSGFQQAKRDALERGRENPLFTGAIGVWDNVILYQSPRVRTANDGAASATVARNLFLGAQGIARVYAYYPEWTEQYFSYGQEQGIAYWAVVGKRLVTFDLNSTETAGVSTDDTAVGAMLYYSAAPTPSP